MSAVSHELGFDWNELAIAGTLHLPGDGGSFPTVLMVQGSGAADRDCDGYFEPIRAVLLDRGIAAYSFDKPGCGASSGDWRDHGIESRFAQTAAAIDALHRHPAVRAEGLGVWGHSQGGWVVQQLASRLDTLAFAIANSGPTITVEAQNTYAQGRVLRSSGRTQGEIGEALAFLADMHAAAKAGEDFLAVGQRLLNDAASKPWFDLFAIEHERDWRHFQILVSEPLDPVGALSGVRCPFMTIFGGLDTLVPPWRGAKESGKALQTAPTDDSAVVVFPDGDHRLQDPQTGEFVVGYLDTLADWIAART